MSLSYQSLRRATRGARAVRSPGSPHPAAAAAFATRLEPRDLAVGPAERLRFRAPERPGLLRFERVWMVVVRRVVKHGLRTKAAAHLALRDQFRHERHGYALPAARMARFTATRASCTLYLLPLSGCAP